MGTTHVTVTIRNPADPTRSWDGLFLVDTGATDSLVPRSCIEAIGLEPEGQRVYETADGREIRMDFTRAYIEFMGDVTAGRVIIGDEGVEPLLGVTALESTGIEVDPVNQRLKRLPALRLKHVALGRTEIHPGNAGILPASSRGGRDARVPRGGACPDASPPCTMKQPE